MWQGGQSIKCSKGIYHFKNNFYRSDKRVVNCSVSADNHLPGIERVLLIIKDFPVHQCGHQKKPETASDCIKSMIGKDNKNR